MVDSKASGCRQLRFRKASSCGCRDRLLQRSKLHVRLPTFSAAAMLHRMVGDGELGEVVPNHLRLDFHVDEVLAVVHLHDRSLSDGCIKSANPLMRCLEDPSSLLTP